MRRLCKVTGWLILLAIVVLSVVPPSDRPVTGAPSNWEHVGIYLLTGIAFGIAYPGRLPAIAPGLILFSGLIEVIQLWVPGRHARLSDFLIDSVATCAGATAIVVAEKLVWLRKSG